MSRDIIVVGRPESKMFPKISRLAASLGVEPISTEDVQRVEFGFYSEDAGGYYDLIDILVAVLEKQS